MAGSPVASKFRLTREQWITLGVLLWGVVSAGLVFAADVADNVFGSHFLEGLRGKAYDFAVSLRPPERRGNVRDDRIIIVGMTAQTFAALGHGGPVPRRYHAQLIRKLKKAGARVIAFDLVFDRDDAEDEGLATAMREHGNVVVAGVVTRQERTGVTEASTLSDTILPNATVRAAATVGLANLPEDETDRTLRRFEWFLMGMGEDAQEVPIPAFGVAAAGRYLGIENVGAAVEEVRRGGFAGTPVARLPGSNSSYIDYLGPPGIGFRHVDYEQVVNPDNPSAPIEGIDPKLIKGAIVLVGDLSGLNQDEHTTPIPNPETDNKMAGVQVQANVIHTILSSHYVQPLPRWAEVLLLLAASLGTALVARRLSPLPGAALVAVTLVAGLGALSLGLTRARVWAEPVTSFFGGAAAFGFATVYMNLTERRRQQELRHQFSRFVGPAVMEDILREGRVELSGELRPITLLFSDLQGFTPLSETRSPREVLQLLNDYFEEMIPIILKYRGTLDKLMGDGIMAYFGAPVPQPDHATLAVRCALEMQEGLTRFRNDPRHAHLPPLYMRIGVHTGDAVVGEVGSRRQRNYSVIGDVVNLAARLEGLNKEFGTSILISESTYQAAKDAAPAEFMGRTQVKGRREPVAVYAVGPRMAESAPPIPKEPAGHARRGDGNGAP